MALGDRQLRRIKGRTIETVCTYSVPHSYSFGGMAVDRVDSTIYLMHNGTVPNSSGIYKVKTDGSLERILDQVFGTNTTSAQYRYFQHIRAFNGKVYVLAPGRDPNAPTAILVMDTRTGSVNLLAGDRANSGVRGDVTGPGENARFTFIYDMTIADDGSIYLLESDSGTVPASRFIKKITPSGFVTRLKNTFGTSAVNAWSGIAVDRASNVYYCGRNNKVNKMDAAGNLTILAGSGAFGVADGQGAAATFDFFLGKYQYPYMAIDPSSQFLYITDYGGIRRIDMDGTVTTVAPRPILRHTHDGINWPSFFPTTFPPAHGIDVDNKGDLYVVYQDP